MEMHCIINLKLTDLSWHNRYNVLHDHIFEMYIVPSFCINHQNRYKMQFNVVSSLKIDLALVFLASMKIDRYLIQDC